MKIVCDVCAKEPAVVFCCADEAALCALCDYRLHVANNVVGKHRRFSLSAPQSNPVVCDVCRERKGFMFCQEDRAILCVECDLVIHTSNNITKRHNRFLLPGVRLPSAAISAELEAAKVSSETTPATKIVEYGAGSGNQNAFLGATESNNGSRISDYLVTGCPGWGVEDFLTDGVDVAMDGFSKVDELILLPEGDQNTGGLVAAVEQFALPSIPVVEPFVPPSIPVANAGRGINAGQFQSTVRGEGSVRGKQQTGNGTRQPWSEDVFMVPQVASTAQVCKRNGQSSWYY